MILDSLLLLFGIVLPLLALLDLKNRDEVSQQRDKEAHNLLKDRETNQMKNRKG